MPSGAQSQEPSDRGPPPVTRAGRSAVLAKAAASSNAPEKRPRGRPRKDGSAGRAVPPPPPPPAPPPQSRTNRRSRSRNQDEDVRIPTAKKPPQKTEVKEVKTVGRRRSASRRKSTPEPEPAPTEDRLSPQPDQTPDPALSVTGPQGSTSKDGLSVPSPKPDPDPGEGDGASSISPSVGPECQLDPCPGLASDRREEDLVDPIPSSPVNSPVCSPGNIPVSRPVPNDKAGPDPGGEDGDGLSAIPSPVEDAHNPPPPPMEVTCSPNPSIMEGTCESSPHTMEEGASPHCPSTMEGTQPRSPCPVEDSCPRSPSPLLGNCTTSTLTRAAAGTASLTPIEGTHPRSPSPMVDPCPRSPSPVEDPCPRSPSPVEDPCPCSPSPVEDPCPCSPSPVEDPCPCSPSPVEDPCPCSPSPVEDPCPCSPSPVEDPCPCSPSPVEDPCPCSPSPVEDPCPCSPSPVEDPCPCSPSPVEDLCPCGPSTVKDSCCSPVPLETTGRSDSPMLQSPNPSPCPSPRLSFSPGEDEDSLSPLFHCSLSDDSGGSPAPSLGHAKKRIKQCAFCYCGDEPPLGQGHLVVFGPTPGYVPLHILNRRASSDRDNDCHDNCYHAGQGAPRCSSPDGSACNEEEIGQRFSTEFLQQLGPIGLPHDINVQSLFDPTGQCCAHVQCASWSEGVCRGEGQALLYVDKAIDSGSTRACVFCHRLGASLRCQEAGCGRSYHYPCAAAAGAHQDWNRRHTFCTRHTPAVSSQCVLCSSIGDVSTQLMCCRCGNRYHGSCRDPPITPSPLCRAGWQCPLCMVCQTCRLRGDEHALLVCERCDKAYHAHCLTPALEDTPGNSWRCKHCRVCKRCGVRSSGQWANHLSLCESCDTCLPCPICDQALGPSSMQNHLTCRNCYRSVHVECTGQVQTLDLLDSYTCSFCKTLEDSTSNTPRMQSPTQTQPSPEAPPISYTQASSLCPHSTFLSSLAPPSPTLAPPSPAQPLPSSVQAPPSPVQALPTNPTQRPPSPPNSPTSLEQAPSEQAPSEQAPASPEQAPVALEQTPSSPEQASSEQALASPEQTSASLEQAPASPEQAPASPEQAPASPEQAPASPEQAPASLEQVPSEQAPASPEQAPASPEQAPASLEQVPSEKAPASPEQAPVSLEQVPSEKAPASPEQAPVSLEQVPSEKAPASPEQAPVSLEQVPSEKAPASPEQAPVSLEQVPLEKAPASPEQAPVSLEQAPASPEEAPSEQAPASPEQDPASSQQDPASSQQDPASPEQDPVSLEQNPVPLEQNPVSLEQNPVSLEQNPVSLEQNPVSLEQAPVSLEQAPVSLEQDPVSLEQAPVSLEQDPVSLEQDPVSLEQAPVSLEQDPVSLEQAPVSLEQAPVSLEQAPVSPEQAPVSPEQAPASPEQAPVSPEQAPASPEQAPASPEQAPASPEQAPASPEQAPASPEQAPASPEQAPVSPKQAPASPPQALSPQPAPPSPTQVQAPPTQAPSSSSQDSFIGHSQKISSTPPCLTCPSKSLTPPLHPSSSSPTHDAHSTTEASADGSTHSTSELALSEPMINARQTPYGSPTHPHRSSPTSTDRVNFGQTQHSTGEDRPVNNPPSPTLQHTENQLGSAEADAELPTAHSSPAHSHYSCMLHSPTQPQPSSGLAEFSTVEVEPDPLPHTSAQDISPRPPGPTNLNITQPQLSAQSSQRPTSPEHRPTEEPTLDQGRPEPSSPTRSAVGPILFLAKQDVSTLDQGSLLPTYCSPTHTLITQADSRPVSLPCSPSQSPPRPTQCSRSSPASPTLLRATPLSAKLNNYSEVNTEAPSSTKISPSHANLTLENNLANLTPTLNLPSTPPASSPTPSTVGLEDSSRLPAPALPAAENLGQVTTSEELNNQASSTDITLTSASPATGSSSHVSPSHCIMAIEPNHTLIHMHPVFAHASPSHASPSHTSPSHASPSHTSEMPATHTPTSHNLAQDSCPLPMDTTPLHMSPTNPIPSATCQEEELEIPVAVHSQPAQTQVSLIHGQSPQASPVHSKSTPASPIHNEANVGTMHTSSTGASPTHQQASSSSTLVSTAETFPLCSPTHIHASCSPLKANQVQASPKATQTCVSPTSTDASLLHRPFSSSITCQTQAGPDTSVASNVHSPAGSSCSVNASLPHDHSSPPQSSLSHTHSPQQAYSTHSSLPNASTIVASPTHNLAHANAICASPTHSSVETSVPCATPTRSPTHTCEPRTVCAPSPIHVTEPCTSPTHGPINSAEPCVSTVHSPVCKILANSPHHTSEPRSSPAHITAHTSEPSVMHTVAVTSPLQVYPNSVEHTDRFSHRRLTPASPLHDDNSTVHFRPISPPQTQETSATETQDSIAIASGLHESQVAPFQANSTRAITSHYSPVHASSSQSSPIHASPVHASFTPSNPNHANPVCASPPQSSPIHASPVRASSPRSSPIHASPVHASSPRSSPIHASPVRASSPRSSPILASPVHASSPQSSPIHACPVRASSPRSSPIHASPVHASSPRSSPIHASPVRASSPRSSPIHASPVHASSPRSSPIHAIPVHASPPLSSPIHAGLAHESSHQSSPIHASPIRASYPKSSPIHTSPVHANDPLSSPIHASPGHASDLQSSPNSAIPGGASPPQCSPNSTNAIHTSRFHSVSTPAITSPASAHGTTMVPSPVNTSVQTHISPEKSPLQAHHTKSQHTSPASSPSQLSVITVIDALTGAVSSTASKVNPGPAGLLPGLLSPPDCDTQVIPADDIKVEGKSVEVLHDTVEVLHDAEETLHTAAEVHMEMKPLAQEEEERVEVQHVTLEVQQHVAAGAQTEIKRMEQEEERTVEVRHDAAEVQTEQQRVEPEEEQTVEVQHVTLEAQHVALELRMRMTPVAQEDEEEEESVEAQHDAAEGQNDAGELQKEMRPVEQEEEEIVVVQLDAVEDQYDAVEVQKEMKPVEQEAEEKVDGAVQQIQQVVDTQKEELQERIEEEEVQRKEGCTEEAPQQFPSAGTDVDAEDVQPAVVQTTASLSPPMMCSSAPSQSPSPTADDALSPQPSPSLSSARPLSPCSFPSSSPQQSPHSSPPRAGSLEVSSSPLIFSHRAALPLSPSPLSSPQPSSPAAEDSPAAASSPQEDHFREVESTGQQKAVSEADMDMTSLSYDATLAGDEDQTEVSSMPTIATKDAREPHAQRSERGDDEDGPIESPLPETWPPPSVRALGTDDEAVARQQSTREPQEEKVDEEASERRTDPPIPTDLVRKGGEGETNDLNEYQSEQECVDEEGRRGETEEGRRHGVMSPAVCPEEQPVSPGLHLDPSLDKEVMEFMGSSSPPASLLHPSSPSPHPFRRAKGWSLRTPTSSRPSDDLSIRLRMSPFSTEASPETSPTRDQATPPPLSPCSPLLSPGSLPFSPRSPPSRATSSPGVPESPFHDKLLLSSSGVPLLPTTVVPLTPKIGMGKPAISKRKFSPGRPRVRQGTWWSNRRAVSPPSSSQDSAGEGGWSSPKPRPADSPLWSMKVGRGAGFSGRRRSRGGGGAGGGRGGRGRSRLKLQENLPVSPGITYAEPLYQQKDEEENSMHNTVVMFSTSDHFTLRQDMCVVCGSFGQGAEGRLLSCSQCGQCYHPYCVNIKITRVILTKGWRCLECTVCEACGDASDPGRLLLCDDCDISYHTYCLDPPLHTVPKGAWKCKWCVWCVQCGATSPGLRSDWQKNYTRCGPCGSLTQCPLCQRAYNHHDLILQCQQCDRWVHALCQGLSTDEDVEYAADEGFECSLCRTHNRAAYGKTDGYDAPYVAQIVTRHREPEVKTFTQDGVRLTESGLTQLQSLVEPLTSPRRYRRTKPKLKLRIINQNSVSVLQTPPDPEAHADLCRDRDLDDGRGEMECEMKSDSSPERDHGHDDDVAKLMEVTDGNKKRKRKPYRPGIGGFMVRQRGGKAGPGGARRCIGRKDSTGSFMETLPSKEEGCIEMEGGMQIAPPADQMEKVRRRYRKKKSQLEESFPSYLQEAFFGRDLLDKSRQHDRRPELIGPMAACPVQLKAEAKVAAPSFLEHAPATASPSTTATNSGRKQVPLSMSKDVLVDLSGVLNTDPHILATGHTGLDISHFQVDRSPSPFAGLDIGSMTDEDPSLTNEAVRNVGRGQRAGQEEVLDAILSPELDKMVTDGAILSRLYRIPELEGKDVEDLFTAVLSPSSSTSTSTSANISSTSHLDHNQHIHLPAGTKTLPLPTAGGGTVMNGLTGAGAHFPAPAMIPSITRAQGQAHFRMPSSDNSRDVKMGQLGGGDVTGPWAQGQVGPASGGVSTAGEGEHEGMSTAQKSTLKWEKEEILGEMATVAPVLYSNIHHPNLKEEYPDWSTRVKQIAKLWRKASSQDRAPYVQKARDNRAAQRINKVQLSNDSLKRQHTPQPASSQGPYDPVSMETEMPFKDSLRPKESEQEQEWKLRQGEVNDTWGAGKKRQENLIKTKALKSPTDKDCPYQAPVAGGGKEALQMRQKSKQQAKIEATQKLEQVKNEQLQQQRQQQQLLGNQTHGSGVSPESGNSSPMMSPQQPMARGNASPLQSIAFKEIQTRPHLLQGSQSSGLADDVFLRPQAPPPSGFSQGHPSSPQMFSPSSRPSSPWDPYSKVVGTPRPASAQQGGPQTPQHQRPNSLGASPAHDTFGCPSPDSKPSDSSRTLGPQQGSPRTADLQQGRVGLMSPPSGSASELSGRHPGIRAAESYQRTPHNSNNRMAEMGPGGLFKTPMPPQHQTQQECYGVASVAGGVGRRESFDRSALPPSRPTDLGVPSPHLQDSTFSSSSPHRSPYSQAPGTPRPDYSQMTEPFPQQASPDPYPNAHAPGTPRPHADPPYLSTPAALRLDQFGQQGANRRPSPSHSALDPYGSMPGTPRPSAAERFPRSPGSQRAGDLFSQGGGASRPSPDPYNQQPSTPRPQKAPGTPRQTGQMESFPPQPGGSVRSPMSQGSSGETGSFPHVHQQLQQSPGRLQQDSFPRTPGAQTPKHPGMSEDGGFLNMPSRTPAHDPFEQGHMTPGPSQTDKTVSNEMTALGGNPLDGAISAHPQLGDSEEKLRQRQRLRQLILRQQQQKTALRQEKGLQEQASGSTRAPAAPSTTPPGPLGTGPTTPRHWSQEDPSALVLQPDIFGRPPPPYPGTGRTGPAHRLPGSFPPSEGPYPRQTAGMGANMANVALRPQNMRFGFPGVPGEQFLRAAQQTMPGSAQIPAEGMPVQIRRPMPGEFTGRPLPAPSNQPRPMMMQGIPQQFLSHTLPLPQHSIMGQTFIELRHRTPDSRVRLPFPLGSPMDQDPRQHLNQGINQVGVPGGLEQLTQALSATQQAHQHHQPPLGHHGHASAAMVGLSQSGVADGMEEHLEGEDSAVKDLEDVEVKDLVDLNLNLDPEDGKEELDLVPNDLHLDDFLLSGKFDLIAYADPELNLEDKKDMFNEDLDLGDPVDEREGGETQRTKEGSIDGVGVSRRPDGHGHALGQVKQEASESLVTNRSRGTVRDGPSLHNPLFAPMAPGRRPGSTSAGPGPFQGSPQQAGQLPGSSAGHIKESMEGAVGGIPGVQPQGPATSVGTAHYGLPSAPAGQPSVYQQQRGFMPQLLLTTQPQPQAPNQALFSQQGPSPPRGQAPPRGQPQAHRPLLLEEQPLLLQDLLDQERQEQQQQRQMQTMIGQRSSSETLPPNMEFDSISDPIMKAKMVALQGINKVMTQGSLGLNPMVINRFQQDPGAQPPERPSHPPQILGQDGKLTPQLARPTPPSFAPGFVNEAERRQYEEWLGETQHLLQMQQGYLEQQIAGHRKAKRALSAKQRTAKKAGRPFSEDDATQLRNITQQQAGVQKQLEQIRKQQKDHAELIEEYKTKQQQQRSLQQQQHQKQQQQQPAMIPPAAPAVVQNMLGQSMIPMQPHPSGPARPPMSGIPAGWNPAAVRPGAMVQRMPGQIPPGVANAPPPHGQQPPQGMVSVLGAPSASFPPPSQVTAGAGSTGAAGPNGAGARQVNFDDNNPFSEGFQERERRERLQEQQERQRVQLMQEVERHRAMQQRLEVEQQSLLGATMGPGIGVGPMPAVGPSSGAGPSLGSGVRVGPSAGPATGMPTPGVESLSQMPFFSSELPQDFLQSPPGSTALQQQEAALQSYATPPGQGQMPGADRGRPQPGHGSSLNMTSPILQTRPRHPGPAGPAGLGQVRPPGLGGPGMTVPQPGPLCVADLHLHHHTFGQDSSVSSAGVGPASLVQLYSEILPEEKPKKKRNRKRDGDDATGARTPLSSYSDDLTAPTTPAVSDTSCSTPTRGNVDQSDLFFHQSSGLASSTELERQLDGNCSLGFESTRGPLSEALLAVKEEHVEGAMCGGAIILKRENGGSQRVSSSPLHGGGGDAGKELLRHLLKDKASLGTTSSPSSQALPACRQLSNDSLRSEDEEGPARPASHNNSLVLEGGGTAELMESVKRKQQQQRCKRLPGKMEKEKGPLKAKRRKKKEEEEGMLYSSSTDTLMTQVKQQLSLLPLMEPVMGVNVSLFPPYGTSALDRDSRLTGSFGNASLDGVTDYYSQLIYKNNLSNPPTPPASLPPTPPPVARHKLVNGFATTEELARKKATLREPEVKGVSGVKQKGEELLGMNHASKTVDVPASLPTPPHNNQEELRSQEAATTTTDRDKTRDSPEGYIPSSSPEIEADTEVSRYPDLSHIKLEPLSPCTSPAIPITPCAWGKGAAIKQEIKAEPSQLGPPSCSSTGLVSIGITLNTIAAQNIPRLMMAIADLLRVPVPASYQVSQQPSGPLGRPGGPDRSSLALLASVRVPMPHGAEGIRQPALSSHQVGNRLVRPPGTTTTTNTSGIRMDYSQHVSSGTRPRGCTHCKAPLLGNVVHMTTKDPKQEGQSLAGSTLVFCSTNCSALYSSSLHTKQADTKPVMSSTLPEESKCASPPSKALQHQYTSNMSAIAVHCLPLASSSSSLPGSPSSSPPLSFPPAAALTMDGTPKTDSLKVTVKLKPCPRAIPGGEESLRHGKRMKNAHWCRWSLHITLPRCSNEAVSMPTEEEVDALLRKLGVCLRPDPMPRDQRRCCFCRQQGDGLTDGPARLLNLDLDLWVHLNCALWSSEVYETQAGALINVELALRRGLTLRCAHCQQTGATSGCNRLRCSNTYHFTCAMQAHCTFFKDKTMLCHLHKPRLSGGGDKPSTSGASPNSPCSPCSTPGRSPTLDPYDSELRCFAVYRRVYVQRDEARQIAAIVQRGERQHTFRVGSLVFRAIGRLLPQQMTNFHNHGAIFPVGYQANRLYWSMRQSNQRCKYMCSIEDKEGEPIFKVKVVEKGYEDLILAGPTPKVVWDQVLEPISELRTSSGTLKLFPAYLKGEDLFGLTTSAVTRIVESLPGVEACDRYTFRYGRNPLMEWPLAFNPSGSARSEPKACQTKRPTLLTSIAPRCQGSVGAIVGLVPGVISLSPGDTMTGAPQGRHSKSAQYRRMTAEWKSNVYLARSRIQGLGLYAARDIEKCTMVIEYIGTIIRSEVANRKERLYESQNRGVYMFRIDNDYVIDATITGGPARYINHSCAPNCITEVVTVERENKIIISSCRRIQRGEELSYDYKFDLEDDQHKIPCHCGALNCRKWMN